jgi:hypothetical protein
MESFAILFLLVGRRWGVFLGIHFEVAEASTARCSGRNTSKLKCTQVSGAERNRSLQPDSVAMSTVRLE